MSNMERIIMADLKSAKNHELIDELLNRATFSGIVICHDHRDSATRDSTTGVQMEKSPSLSRSEVESLLETTTGLVRLMFGEKRQACSLLTQRGPRRSPNQQHVRS